MVKVTHIITSLNSGGAESMLYKLLKYSNSNEYTNEVICLLDKGIYGEKIEKMGIKVTVLNLNKGNIIGALYKARRVCEKSDIVNSWLYHSDLVGFFISKVLLRKKLIWNVRHSNLDKSANKKTTLLIVKLNARLSRYVDCITYNSNKAKYVHNKIGYTGNRNVVLSNGFELNKFTINNLSRKKLRKNFDIHDSEKVLITVGRWDPQKDYDNLLKSLGILRQNNINFRLIMVGTNLDWKNIALKKLIERYNLAENVLLLGRQGNIPELLSVADIYVSSSLGESFSNSIGEAMACQLPCIVTDVGDSAIIVGDCGEIVPSQNSEELSNELSYYIKMDNENLQRIGKKARKRVVENYDIINIVKLFEINYTNTIRRSDQEQ